MIQIYVTIWVKIKASYSQAATAHESILHDNQSRVAAVSKQSDHFSECQKNLYKLASYAATSIAVGVERVRLERRRLDNPNSS